MLKNMLLLTVFIFTTSCVSTFQIDGKPIPDHVYTQVNPRTSIKTDFIFIRYIEVKEGKEKFLTPAYLELNKDIIIPNDTESLYINLQIVNTQKISYTLIKNFKVWDNSSPYPYKVTQVVSKSKQSNRVHHINLPMKKGIKVNFGFRLLDEKGTFIMNIGQAKYTTELLKRIVIHKLNRNLSQKTMYFKHLNMYMIINLKYR